MTHSELAAALDAKRYDILWFEAVPLARFAVRQMVRSGQLEGAYHRDDILQEAIAAAGEAIRTWDPIEGAFSTWVVAAVKGAVLTYIAREMNGLQAARYASRYGLDEDFFEHTDETGFTYPVAPEGYADPFEEVARADRDEITVLLNKLHDPDEQDMICRLYGLDCEPQTQIEYARSKDVSLSTVKKRLALTLEFLRQTAKKLRG